MASPIDLTQPILVSVPDLVKFGAACLAGGIFLREFRLIRTSVQALGDTLKELRADYETHKRESYERHVRSNPNLPAIEAGMTPGPRNQRAP